MSQEQDQATRDQTILKNIDLLIYFIIKLAYAKYEEQEKYLENIEELLANTSPLLLQLTDGKQELLEPMYKQLLSQKIPHDELINNFAGIKMALDKVFTVLAMQTKITAGSSADICAGCSADFHSAPVTKLDSTVELPIYEPAKTTPASRTEINTPAKNDPLPPEVILEKLLQTIYPQEKIIRNHYLHNIKLDYYLPEQKIAILLVSLPHRTPTGLKMLSHKAGLKLIEISQDDFYNLPLSWEKLARSLPKLLIMRNQIRNKNTNLIQEEHR
jgi:hypothetical protein